MERRDHEREGAGATASGARRRLWEPLVVPVPYKRFYRSHRDRAFRLLDVGCGFHAPSKALQYFPRCSYYGLDREDSGLDENDRRAMKGFYRLDLENDSLVAVPDDSFDVVVISHVIEHLHFGLEALGALTEKLREGGLMYIEYPGPKSLAAPRARKGCLHFHDDPTHVRMYALHEVVNTLLDHGMKIVAAGTRRDKIRLLLSPLLLLRGLQRGDLWSARPWDLWGIAEFVFARKTARADGHAPSPLS